MTPCPLSLPGPRNTTAGDWGPAQTCCRLHRRSGLRLGFAQPVPEGHPPSAFENPWGGAFFPLSQGGEGRAGGEVGEGSAVTPIPLAVLGYFPLRGQ